MRRISSPGRVLSFGFALFIAVLPSVMPAVADCSDDHHSIPVWYTRAGIDPRSGDECSFQKIHTYSVGRCFSFPYCRTDNCNFSSDWRGEMLRRALNDTIGELGYSVQSSNPNCGELTLWGSLGFSRALQIKWSLAQTFLPVGTPAVGAAGVYWGDQSQGFTRLLQVRRNAVIEHHSWGGEVALPIADREGFATGPSPTSPSIGSDGTIFELTDHVYAFNAFLVQKWTYPANAADKLRGAPSVPAVAADGTVYFTTSQGWVYAVRSNGTLAWERQLGGTLTGVSLGSAPTLYVGSANGLLYALDKNGESLWTYAPVPPSRPNFVIGEVKLDPPSIAADGTLFVPVSLKYCLFGLCNYGSLSDGILVSLTPHDVAAPAGLAKSRWVFNPSGDLTLSGAPAIATFGDSRSLAFGVGNKVYALQDAEDFGHLISNSSSELTGLVSGTPAIGEGGSIFATTKNGWVYSLSQTTTEQWRLNLGGTLTAPTLDDNASAADAVLYVGSTTAAGGGVLHAVYAGTGPAVADWPMAGRDPGHSAQAHRGISVSPLSWDFGPVPLGQTSAPLEFKISNNGDEPILVGSIVLGGQSQEFIYEEGQTGTSCGLAFSLQPGSSCTSRVTFRPLSLDAKTLEIAIDAGHDPALDHLILRLHGRSDGPAIDVTPTELDFGTAPPSGSNRLITIKNEGTTNLHVTEVAFSDAAFTLNQTLPLTVAPNALATLQIRFIPAVPGLAAATMRIRSDDSKMEYVRVLLHGVSDTQGVTSLFGYVKDNISREPLGGATVHVGTALSGSSSNADIDRGFYRIDGVPSTPFQVTASRAGYVTSSAMTVVPAFPTVIRDIELTSECRGVPRVDAVFVEGLDADVTFVHGVSHNVTVKATVDWCGTLAANENGKVVFHLENSTSINGTVDTHGTTASFVLNVGDLPVCAKLAVRAEAHNGLLVSNELTAPFNVMPRVLPDLSPISFGYTQIGNKSFSFNSEGGVNFAFFDFLGDMVKKEDRSKAPLSGLAAKLKWVPRLSEEYESDGEYKVKLAFDNVFSGGPSEDPTLPRFDFPKYGSKGTTKGASVVPFVDITGKFQERTCTNSAGGYVGLTGQVEAESIAYFAPYPIYGKLGCTAGLSARLGVIGIGDAATGPRFAGELLASVELKGTVGVGIADLLAAEAWVSGGVEFEILPKPLHFCEITAKGGITFYAVLYDWTETLAQWNWDCSGSNQLSFPTSFRSGPTAPALVSRAYAFTDDYATFHGRLAETAAAGGTNPSKALMKIQTNVFPRSETVASASGDKVYLVWLYDDPSRADDNRTLATFSSWNGEAWSAPIAVSDDGTADFHPRLLTLPDGSAHVVWENLREAPAPALSSGLAVDPPAPLPGALRNLEICTSRFDPTATPPFGPQQCLTNNDHLDRSPTLAGVAADNLLLAWVSNENLDAFGLPVPPSAIWSSRFDGTTWSVPQQVAELTAPLNKLSLAYDGTDGYLVMSLDAEQPSLVCAVDHKTRCQTDADCQSLVCTTDRGTQCETDADCGGGVCEADGDGTCELADAVIDRELFLKHYDRATNTWDNPQSVEPVAQLTDDDLVDDSPKVTLDATGKFLLVWLQDDRLVSVSDLAAFVADPAPASVRPIWQDKAAEYSSNLSAFEFAKNGDQLGVVWAQPLKGEYSDLVASLYDPRHGLWSVPRVINEPDSQKETYIAATFDFPDHKPRLLAVYDRSAVPDAPPPAAPAGPGGAPDPRLTDLVMQLYPLRDDPALDESSLVVAPISPEAGDAVIFSVNVRNLGDRGLERAAVVFRAGDQEIATVDPLADPATILASGETIQATLAWVVPADAPAGLLITAELVPDPAIDDRDLNNNDETLALLAPDLTVQGVSRKHLDGAAFEITANIANVGSAAAAGPILVKIRDGADDGPVLLEQTIDPLAAGAASDVALQYVFDLSLGRSTAELVVVVDEPNAIPESDETNNTRTLVIPTPNTALPTITAPDSLVFEAEGPQGATVTFEASAVDSSGGAIPVSCNLASGSTVPFGETQIICTATDVVGNVASKPIFVSVVDTTPPALTAPDDMTVECAGPAGTSVAELGTPAASDLYCVDDIVVENDAPEPFPLGATTVTWTATDCNDNAATDAQLVTVVDTGAPSVTCPPSVTMECQSDGHAYVSVPPAIAADVCHGTATLLNDQTPNGADASGDYPLGSTLVAFTATDGSGNSASCTTLVTVVDSTRPVVTVNAAPSYLWPPNHHMLDVHTSVTVFESCDPSRSLVLDTVVSSEPDDAAGGGDGNTTNDIQGASLGTEDFDISLRAERMGSGPGRTYTVRYTATDHSGNVGTAIDTISVPHDRDGIVEPLVLSVGDPLATTLSWEPVYWAHHFDAIRGKLEQLTVLGSTINLGATVCLEMSGVTNDTIGAADTAIPEPGRAFFYLVQFNDGSEESSYGENSVSRARVLGAGSQLCH